MTSAHIVIPTTTPLGAKLARVKDAMRTAHSLLSELIAIAGTYNGDYVKMAGDFGFTSVEEMTDAAGITTLAWSNAVNSPEYVEMINKLG